jgi:hypothetical protein
MNLSSWQSLGYDTHSQIVLPESQLFVNHNNGDFHLLPSSQPLDIGTSLVSSIVAVDADGVVRPQGSGYDIGAYEYKSTTSVEDEKVVNDFKLYQNYPNPFNPSTTIQYAIDSRQFVTLKVYDILGKEVVTLVEEFKPAGKYGVSFDASLLPSGVYIYQLIVRNYIQTRKMVLLK